MFITNSIFLCCLQNDDDRYHLNKNLTEKGLNKNVKYFHSSNWTTNYLIMLFWKSSFFVFLQLYLAWHCTFQILIWKHCSSIKRKIKQIKHDKVNKETGSQHIKLESSVSTMQSFRLEECSTLKNYIYLNMISKPSNIMWGSTSKHHHTYQKPLMIIMFRDILNYNFQFLLLLSGKKVRTTNNKIQNEMYQPRIQ